MKNVLVTNVNRGRTILAGVALLCAFLTAGCGATLQSRWRDRDVTIDGDCGEWEGLINYFEDEEISAGLLNDGRYLYITLVAENRQRLAQIASGGCTAWLDTKDRPEKSFGIRYPLGVPPEVRRDFMRGLTEGAGADSVLKAFGVLSGRLEVVGPDEGDARPIESGQAGIVAAARCDHGMFTCEIRVPLAPTSEEPYAIGADPGEKIRVGIETPEVAMPGQRPEGGPEGGPGGRGPGMPGSGPPGGRGGPGGGGPGGRGGPRPGGGEGGPEGMGQRPESPEAIDLWIDVRLAETSPSK